MKFALCVVILLILSRVCAAQIPTVTNQVLPQEELQIAIRRYMQCQADNVGAYNDQMRIVIEKNEKLLAEFNKVREELAQEKSKAKVTTE